LHTEYLTPEQNRTAFGKCNNPNGHGHNYIVLVTVGSGSGSEAVTDIARLDQVVNEHIIRRFDHHDLNQDSEFSNRTTTGENLVVLIWDLLAPHLPVKQLLKVGVIETRDNYFEYSGSVHQVTQSTGVRHG